MCDPSLRATGRVVQNLQTWETNWRWVNTLPLNPTHCTIQPHLPTVQLNAIHSLHSPSMAKHVHRHTSNTQRCKRSIPELAHGGCWSGPPTVLLYSSPKISSLLSSYLSLCSSYLSLLAQYSSHPMLQTVFGNP